jgi:aspartate carbamoyltransferase catalytic subunit
MTQNLLSIRDVSRDAFEALCSQADTFRQQPDKQMPIDTTQQGGLLFFESSTRTRIGFETAAWKLGIKTVAIYETKQNDTMSSGETIADTIRTLNPYVSFYCVRHSDEDIFDQIIPNTTHPVVNCGNGHKEHPTQALIDGYTIASRFGGIDGLSITMTGALRYSRAANSLLSFLAGFKDITISGFTEPELDFSEDAILEFTKNGNKYKLLVHQTGGVAK